VSRAISVDPYRNPQSQHDTQVEPDSFAVGSSVLAVFQSGRIFGGGASNIGFSLSRNSGRTWTGGFLPSTTANSTPAGPWPIVSDPSVAYDARHGIWLIASLAVAADQSAVIVHSSADGVHWEAPVSATVAPTLGPLLLDKEWIVCDNGASSPFRGHCYVSYSDFRTNEVSTQASSDGGVTWGPPTSSPDAPGRASLLGNFAPGVQPVVRPDGMVVIPYYDENRVAAIRSTDGGATYFPAVGIAPARYHGVPRLRVSPLPVAEVGADGTVYVAWADCGPSAGCSRNSIVLSSSRDGASWSAPARVPTGSADAEIPALAADPAAAGRLVLAYYTVSGTRFDVWLVASRNGGATWTKPQRLSTQSIPPEWIAATSGGFMVGDYISTSFAGGRAVPVFVLARKHTGSRLHESAFAASFAVPR
jgi:BNR repeat-like domain